MKQRPEKSNKGNKGVISQGVAPFDVAAFDPSVPFDNEGHERFCLEVLNRKPLVRAYQLAYPDCSYDSARSAAGRLFADVCIQARLAYLKEEQRNRLKMSADDVLMGLEMAARFDPADLYNPDGTMIPVQDLPPEIRLCIEKIEFEEITVGEGENKRNIGRTGKIHTISKKSAYELLGKTHKLFTDKVIHEHKFSLEDILSGTAEEVEK